MPEKKATVFIVDDEPMLNEMLSDYLTNNNPGLFIKTFPTGEACLESLNEEPDVIILDYYLNSREKDAANGIDILKEIKGRKKAVPVIMLSSQDSYGKAAQTIQYGAIHYVIKGREAFREILELVEANI